MLGGIEGHVLLHSVLPLLDCDEVGLCNRQPVLQQTLVDAAQMADVEVAVVDEVARRRCRACKEVDCGGEVPVPGAAGREQRVLLCCEQTAIVGGDFEGLVRVF